MKLTLTVHQQFEATHSLEGNETPHPHVWSVELRFETRANVETGEGLVKGKLVDIPSVQKGFDAIVAPLRGTYLNDSEFVDSWVRATPTC